MTLGILVTWAFGTVTAYLLFDLSFDVALVLGAVLVVSGPTVVGPLLDVIRPSKKVNLVLKWEGTLADPIGATLGVVVFNAVVAGHAKAGQEVFQFFLNVGVGVGFGVADTAFAHSVTSPCGRGVSVDQGGRGLPRANRPPAAVSGEKVRRPFDHEVAAENKRAPQENGMLVATDPARRRVKIRAGRTGAHHRQHERREGDQEPEGVVDRDLQAGVDGGRPFEGDRVERRQVDEAGQMRADPGGDDVAGGGVAQVPAEPRARDGGRRARAAPTRRLNPAPVQTGRQAERRRTEGDVEHGRERQPPGSHVGTVEDRDHDQADRPAPGKACGDEEEQEPLWPGLFEQHQDRRQAPYRAAGR